MFVFHSNSLDADKQMAINVFLGVFQPQEGEKNVWELSTDYYLHHTLARVLPQTHSTSSHTKWWDDHLLHTLPLPLYGGGWGCLCVCVCVCVCVSVCVHCTCVCAHVHLCMYLGKSTDCVQVHFVLYSLKFSP